MYQPYPTGGQGPVAPPEAPAPQSMLTAVRLMYAGAALNATATVRVSFDRLPVSADRVTGRYPSGGVTPPEVLRMHAALALGVVGRCCRMIGPTGLDAELSALRTELDGLGPDTAAASSRCGPRPP